MPLYELVCITTRPPTYGPLRTLTSTLTSMVTERGGVVRTFDNWGYRNLPSAMSRGLDTKGHVGVYFSMRFDVNPPTVKALNERLRVDPRVLRWTLLKVGDTFKAVTEPQGDRTVRYQRKEPDENSRPSFFNL